MLSPSFVAAALCALISLPSVSAVAAPSRLVTRDDVPVTTTTYTISKNITGHKFYDNFHFFDQKDPTDGLVQYLNLQDARTWNLTSVSEDATTFYMSGDATETLQVGQGRKSTRIETKYEIDNHVHILDVAHMPQGLGTWPAYWLVGANWPSGGEVDIIEGANDIAPNLMTVHTTPNCTMDAMTNRSQTGHIKYNDCNAYANGNIGCGIYGTKGNDFGPKLNAGNGGYFAYQKTDNEMKVWFWKRYSPGIPLDVLDPHRTSVNPDNWGVPDAHWASSTSCDLRSKLLPMKIIINLTFCGGFAGHTYPLPGGTAACEEYVRNNPQEFKDAYWKIYGLRIYE